MGHLYQRKYQWHDTQLIPFWEDEEPKAIEVLEGESRFYLRIGRPKEIPELKENQQRYNNNSYCQWLKIYSTGVFCFHRIIFVTL